MEILVNGDSIQVGDWHIEVVNGKLVITNTARVFQTSLAEFPVEIYSHGETVQMSARSIKLPL